VHFWLLPFLEQTDLMRQWDGKTGANGWNGLQQIHTPGAYICPSDPTMTPDTTTNSGPPLATGADFALTSYSFNGQVFGDAQCCPVASIPKSFADGTSSTLLVLERYSICGQNGDVRTWGDGAGFSANSEVTFLTATGDTPAVAGLAWVNNNVTAVFQVAPDPKSCTTSRKIGAATPHQSMCALMGDGAVRHITASVTLNSWRAVITPAGDDMVGSDIE
jgi:hypothetical protein